MAAAPPPSAGRGAFSGVPYDEIPFKELQRLHARRMEFFGFGGWLASTLFYVLFLVWAYAPEETLHAYGLTYYPSKRWAVAVPAMLVATYVFSIVLYKAVNLLGTPAVSDYATVLDTHSVRLPQRATTSADVRKAATPSIADLPLFDVNRALFDASSDEEADRDSDSE